jgi:hypothetical protein
MGSIAPEYSEGLRFGWAPMIDYYWGVFDVERTQRAAADVLRFRADGSSALARLPAPGDGHTRWPGIGPIL